MFVAQVRRNRNNMTSRLVWEPRGELDTPTQLPIWGADPHCSSSSWDPGFLMIICGARAAFSSWWRSLFCSWELQSWKAESFAASGCCSVNSMGFWHLHHAKWCSFISQWLGQSLSIALPLCLLEFCFQFGVQAHPRLRWNELNRKYHERGHYPDFLQPGPVFSRKVHETLKLEAGSCF